MQQQRQQNCYQKKRKSRATPPGLHQTESWQDKRQKQRQHLTPVAADLSTSERKNLRAELFAATCAKIGIGRAVAVATVAKFHRAVQRYPAISAIFIADRIVSLAVRTNAAIVPYAMRLSWRYQFLLILFCIHIPPQKKSTDQTVCGRIIWRERAGIEPAKDNLPHIGFEDRESHQASTAPR